jgi:demethylmenaquinone methyltransferase / 2-methoxy-6-polyprenyl-1,4-benzoquinol methylase
MDTYQDSIGNMFDSIACNYDTVNRVLSCGLDIYWRKKVGAFFPELEKIKLLDCATGTADQLFYLLKKKLPIQQATGIDISEKMLLIAEKKLKKHKTRASLQKASVTQIPYLDNTFDVATISFGIRNIPKPMEALKEIYRVLSHRGRILILEFSIPTNFFIRKGYLFYLNTILPKLGKILSSNPMAYLYLSQTIQTFPQGSAFCSFLEEAGFTSVKKHPLSFGIVTIYQGDKCE